MKTSALLTNARSLLWSVEVLRSRYVVRLPRLVSRSRVGREGSDGDVIHRTEAPCVARVRPAMGAARTRLSSRMWMPSRQRGGFATGRCDEDRGGGLVLIL